MDTKNLKYCHGSNIHAVQACYSSDGADLLAVGGEHSVEVLQINAESIKRIASFNIGTPITALAWSPRSISSSVDDEWTLELAAAAADFSLHLLTKSSNFGEQTFSFGGGLSGHHGKINDMAFCGGEDEDSARYVATVSDDKMLMVWDLLPSVNIRSVSLHSPNTNCSASTPARPQPTAYVISFPHPLTSVNSHSSTGNGFLVSDSHGSIYLTDWRSDPETTEQGSWRHSSLVELVDPHALSDALTGLIAHHTGSVAWRRDASDIIGANYGSRFSIWDLSHVQGGKPIITGISFAEGGRRFRWCQVDTDHFAIAGQSPANGAVIHVHNIHFVQAQPVVVNVAPRPHCVGDFDFLALKGLQPILAVAVGRELSLIPFSEAL